MSRRATGIVAADRRDTLRLLLSDFACVAAAMTEYLVSLLPLVFGHGGIQSGKGARELLDVGRMNLGEQSLSP